MTQNPNPTGNDRDVDADRQAPGGAKGEPRDDETGQPRRDEAPRDPSRP